jgi:glycyl-tRNA synthetase beta subunit
MTRSGLRTLFIEVMREELPARRSKSARAQHASEMVEVSEVDRAAARAIARRMGLHVRGSKP